ncbi:hypothetical protein SDC9_146357 [bioreactor metagenome]|uniref:Uncharacterized protein n=1 Tax=bioreactor metagenome TaxID=1076179 RepID=A0A645EBV7_9ZZZZ
MTSNKKIIILKILTENGLVFKPIQTIIDVRPNEIAGEKKENILKAI